MAFFHARIHRGCKAFTDGLLRQNSRRRFLPLDPAKHITESRRSLELTAPPGSRATRTKLRIWATRAGGPLLAAIQKALRYRRISAASSATVCGQFRRAASVLFPSRRRSMQSSDRFADQRSTPEPHWAMRHSLLQQELVPKRVQRCPASLLKNVCRVAGLAKIHTERHHNLLIFVNLQPI